jgi:CRP-like cAMP-binding protein
MSLFWAFTTLIGLGANPQPPSNNVQLWYTMLVVFVGVFVLAVIIGNTLEIIANLNEASENFRKTMDTINVFMFRRDVPKRIRKRVQLYYEYLLSKDGMDDSQILSSLPEHLRFDLSLYLNRELIRKVPFFYDSEVGFIRRLAVHLKPQLYSPGDYILKEGEIGDSMYFISKGLVEVVASNGQVLSVLKSGSFFGEIAILFKCMRTASVRAVKYTHVYILNKQDLDATLKEYPQYIPKIQSIASMRLKELHIEASPDAILHIPRKETELESHAHERHPEETWKEFDAKYFLSKSHPKESYQVALAKDLDWVKGMSRYSQANLSALPLSELRYVSQKLSECLAHVTTAIHAQETKNAPASTKNPI